MRELLVTAKAFMPPLQPWGYQAMLVFIVVYRHQQGKPVVCFHPLQACMEPFSTLKAGPREGGFQVSSGSGNSSQHLRQGARCWILLKTFIYLFLLVWGVCVGVIAHV